MTHSRLQKLILAPLSVSIVVVTLGAAFGVLSGRGAFIGMVSAVIISMVTALISGGRYGISSPTGPMTAAIAVILLEDQKWFLTHSAGLDPIALMNLTLVFAGLFLLAFAILRIHKLVKLIPNLVVSGFVNGIALLIIFSQIRAIELAMDWGVMIITFLVSAAFSQFGKRSKHSTIRILTSSFFVISLLSLIIYRLQLPVTYMDFSTDLAALKPSFPALSSLDSETLKIVLPLALELALIALLDTILTSVIIDKRTRTRSNLDRELTGQSAAMFGVSLIGGIPGAQSTVPSMMLVEEGGHDKQAKLFTGLFCLLITFLFAGLIEFVPLAVFGGVILKIAIDVADFTSLKNLFACPKNQKFIRFCIVIGTCLSTVLISLNLAVIGFTFLFILWNQIFPKRFRIPDLSAKQSEGLADEF